MLGSGLGLTIVSGCKVDKIFRWAALVPMERRAPLAPMGSQEQEEMKKAKKPPLYQRPQQGELKAST